MRAIVPLTLLLAACPKPAEGDPLADVQVHDPAVKRDFPEPLPETPFEAPKVETRKLSNGMQVVIASNNEVPLVRVEMAFKVAGFADEVPGTARVTFDMLNEGAGDLSAEQISGKLKAMASTLSTRAGVTSGSVQISTLKRNLAATLDLMETVVEEPTFPAEEWELRKVQYIAGVKQAKADPNSIASRVRSHVIYGDAYGGEVEQEAHFEAMSPDTMKTWWKTYAGPENAILLVGGDVTADEIVPMLEERFGSWKPEGIQSPEAAPEPKWPDASTLYLVDKPGAAQSVVSVVNEVGTRTDPDWFQWDMGMDVLGGLFVSRMNMNLREDKAYTYGARCRTSALDGPGIAVCSASVKTAVTGPSLVEIRKELTEIRGERPITDDEIAYMKSTTVNGYPRRFETPSTMLGEQEAIWRYGLPADWPATYLDNVTAVTRDQAQAAFEKHWDPNAEVWIVVGDKSVIGDDLEAFGLPVVELDVDGNPIGE